jgi:DNA-binding response OmpR family regulator
MPDTVLVIDDSPTILKVVQLVLTKAGFAVQTAADGESGLDAAKAVKPDLILLDFVMPRLNGYQVCRALAADESLQKIPVVLMSAKGDQVGERFVKVMGIVDYITKPFSPEAITAVVQHTIGKYGPAQRGDGKEATAYERRLAAEMAASGAGGEGAKAAERQRLLEEVRSRIVRIVSGKVGELVSLADAAQGDQGAEDDREAHGPTDAAAIAEAARSGLDDDTLLGLLEAGRSLLDGAELAPVLSGNLQVVPIADVLQLLSGQKQSGALHAVRGGATVTIYFRAGAVELATSDGMGAEFLLVRFIDEAALMAGADLDRVQAERDAGAGLSGSELVKLNQLSADDLRIALRRQTVELVYEVLRWNVGNFRFQATTDLPPEAIEAGLGLDVEGIMMEGFRRVDEWHLIEREIDDFDLVFLRNEDAVAQMGRGRLTREELAVLELVNGKNPVKRIIRDSRMGSFEVSKMLYRLLSIKLIRKRVMPVAV